MRGKVRGAGKSAPDIQVRVLSGRRSGERPSALQRDASRILDVLLPAAAASMLPSEHAT